MTLMDFRCRLRKLSVWILIFSVATSGQESCFLRLLSQMIKWTWRVKRVLSAVLATERGAEERVEFHSEKMHRYLPLKDRGDA